MIQLFRSCISLIPQLKTLFKVKTIQLTLDRVLNIYRKTENGILQLI